MQKEEMMRGMLGATAALITITAATHTLSARTGDDDPVTRTEAVSDAR